MFIGSVQCCRKKIWPEYKAARSGFLTWPLWLLNVPSVQLSGQPCKMEFSVFCPRSSCVLRAEQLQPCTARLLAWLIITPRTKELLGSTIIIHSLHSWVLRTRAIKTACMMSIGQQTTASWYWCDLPHFDNVKQTWLLLLRHKMDLKYAVQLDTDDLQ